jgi:hypothetical protein
MKKRMVYAAAAALVMAVGLASAACNRPGGHYQKNDH